ncbi:hypothetical protein WR25_07743 [Diploscapter pachys]|uniref:Myosin N-terminal SH3-like domain-containing protein n=1 Tax=Diploscapter pachys TaxID=2018661 RepID=A0A2A2J6N9_9BILA|nr:hypothetical protein WR25_07743 [Diploscapter pachys]
MASKRQMLLDQFFGNRGTPAKKSRKEPEEKKEKEKLAREKAKPSREKEKPTRGRKKNLNTSRASARIERADSDDIQVIEEMEEIEEMNDIDTQNSPASRHVEYFEDARSDAKRENKSSTFDLKNYKCKVKYSQLVRPVVSNFDDSHSQSTSQLHESTQEQVNYKRFRKAPQGRVNPLNLNATMTLPPNESYVPLHPVKPHRRIIGDKEAQNEEFFLNFLFQSISMKRKIFAYLELDQSKPYDSKKNCWIPDAEEGYIEGEIKGPGPKADLVIVKVADKEVWIFGFGNF